MAILYKNVRANVVNLLPLMYFIIYQLVKLIRSLVICMKFIFQFTNNNCLLLDTQKQYIIGNGHIFAGIINDVVMGLPLGISAISYLTVAFTASYVRQVTVNISLF